MKTQIKGLDDIVKHEKGTLFILCGNNPLLLNALANTLINNYCRQKTKCLYISKSKNDIFEDLEEVAFCVNSEEDITPMEYDLTNIQIGYTIKNIKTFIEVNKNINFDNIFIKLSNAEANSDLFFYLGNILMKKQPNIFLIIENKNRIISTRQLMRYHQKAEYLLNVENDYEISQCKLNVHYHDFENNEFVHKESSFILNFEDKLAIKDW